MLNHLKRFLRISARRAIEYGLIVRASRWPSFPAVNNVGTKLVAIFTQIKRDLNRRRQGSPRRRAASRDPT